MFRAGWNEDQLRVTTEQRGHTAHLRVSGEIDLMTAPAFEGWLRSAEGNGSAAISVDLGDVTFMDAGGLRVLLRASERAVRSERVFVVLDPPTCVLRLIAVTRTTHLLGTEARTSLHVPDQQSLHAQGTP